MTQEMKGLLLEVLWAPVTSEMGFLKLGAEQAAQAFATWQRGLVASRDFTLEVLPVSGTLEQALSRLLPLTSGERQRRYLFIPTCSAWTAYVSSVWTGTDAASPLRSMARRLSIRCLRVVAVPHTLRKQQGGRYGAVMLGVYGPERPGNISSTVRALAAANDGGRWVFEQSGSGQAGSVRRSGWRPTLRHGPNRPRIDVHKRDSHVCVLGETGGVVLERRMPTQREKLAA